MSPWTLTVGDWDSTLCLASSCQSIPTALPHGHLAFERIGTMRFAACRGLLLFQFDRAMGQEDSDW
jgi:hypothetical protein